MFSCINIWTSFSRGVLLNFRCIWIKTASSQTPSWACHPVPPPALSCRNTLGLNFMNRLLQQEVEGGATPGVYGKDMSGRPRLGRPGDDAVLRHGVRGGGRPRQHPVAHPGQHQGPWRLDCDHGRLPGPVGLMGSGRAVGGVVSSASSCSGSCRAARQSSSTSATATRSWRAWSPGSSTWVQTLRI